MLGYSVGLKKSSPLPPAKISLLHPANNVHKNGIFCSYLLSIALYLIKIIIVLSLNQFG